MWSRGTSSVAAAGKKIAEEGVVRIGGCKYLEERPQVGGGGRCEGLIIEGAKESDHRFEGFRGQFRDDSVYN